MVCLMRTSIHLKLWQTDYAEAVVVVTIRRIVVVTIGNTTVRLVVVPTTATKHLFFLNHLPKLHAYIAYFVVNFAYRPFAQRPIVV